ncbi:ABC transporter substrate-binding protein [Caballeronia sp. LZ033]|uniref:ABC transporter substrate-binding protein n=1 Tax=Caballeronia sp. LZ033 TaxID=3038566 RepID=UPI00285F101E|nr:ABC transporter substrate-binding protein [Caballeronia sp. LZ033]MDR5818309.1 ABC transporter substrate-binding protein [Caballeronia sp. LZ033]
MTSSRRTFLKQASWIGAAAATAGISAGFAPLARAAAVPVNYGGSAWLGHYAAYVAMKTDIFTKLGIDCRWQSFSTSSARMGAVMSGNLDIAGTGVVSALALMANGAKQFQLITTPNNFGKSEGLLVHANVKSLADLKGKKIGVTYASSSHVLLLDVLRQANMDPTKDVSIINLPATELLTAYRGNQIDAAAAWTPTFDRIRALPDTKLLLDDSSFSLYKQFQLTPGPDVLLVRTAFASAHPEVPKAFLQGIAQANDLMTQQPEKAAPILMTLTSLSQDEQMAVLKQTQWYSHAQQKALFVGNGGKPGPFVDGVQKLSDMLVDLKQIDQSPKVADWINATYL